MYQAGGMVEQAASMYLSCRNYGAAASLMAAISSAKLQLQYARAMEEEGRWEEAVAAYQTAGEAGVRGGGAWAGLHDVGSNAQQGGGQLVLGGGRNSPCVRCGRIHAHLRS